MPTDNLIEIVETAIQSVIDNECADKRVMVYQPAGLDPTSILPHSRWLKADGLRVQLDQVIRKAINRAVDDDGWARLKFSVLAQRIPSSGIATNWKAMREGGVVERDSYVVGQYSRGYRLTDEWAAQPLQRRAITDRELVAKAIACRARYSREQAERRLPIHDRLKAIQEGCLGVNHDRALQLLASMNPRARNCQTVLVDRIRSGQMRFHVGRTWRVSNGLTGIKRELRAAITLDGQQLGSVDMRSAQPRWLAYMLEGTLSALPRIAGRVPDSYRVRGLIPAPCVRARRLCPFLYDDDVQRFRDVVGDDVYSFLSNLWGVSREESKVRFMKDVVAKRGAYPSEYRKRFTAEFPSIVEFINWFNLDSHANLVRYLQRLEAWFVIEQVCPLLVDRVPVVTVHDCLFCPVTRLGEVENAFVTASDRLGYSFPTKLERHT